MSVYMYIHTYYIYCISLFFPRLCDFGAEGCLFATRFRLRKVAISPQAPNGGPRQSGTQHCNGNHLIMSHPFLTFTKHKNGFRSSPHQSLSQLKGKLMSHVAKYFWLSWDVWAALGTMNEKLIEKTGAPKGTSGQHLRAP